MCSSQASGNKLWDHFSFMAPLLMERNSTQTTFQHLPAGIQEFVNMDFFGSEGFHGGCDCWGYGVWGEGEERFVDQLTRIFERQLFFRNLYQSFQQRYKKAAHLQNILHDFFRRQPYFKAEPENHKTEQCAHACSSWSVLSDVIVIQGLRSLFRSRKTRQLVVGDHCC